MSYLTAFGTSNPETCIKQADVVEFMIKAHGLEGEEARNLRILYRATGIQQRYTTIPDYSDTQEREFFSNRDDLSPFPTTAVRNDRFQKHAIEIAVQAAEKSLTERNREKITHLIAVSCTGLYAPGLDIELIEKLDLPKTVERTGINFMGCYAAFNALKTADYICRAEPQSQVLIVAVELCTLHFQKDPSEDNLLASFDSGIRCILATER